MTTPFDTVAYFDSLQQLAKQKGFTNGSNSRELAIELDNQDGLKSLRKEYQIPLMKDVVKKGSKRQDEQSSSLYMCGNSLGPLSKRSKLYVEQELQVWGQKAVLGHWDHPFGRPWTRCEERVSYLMSDIIGAKPNEVVAMGTLSSNLHIMLATFYRPEALPKLVLPKERSPSPKRHKIIYEALAFPSDQYALASAVTLAGFDPKTSLIALEGKKSRTLETEDVLQTIDREAGTGELAMILLGDVQYQTGQMFDMERITKHARSKGIIVGWDLAHAFANVPLAMHDWDADFAVWCTYKYGSSGPGGMAGLFVHERWGNIGFQTCMGRDAKMSKNKDVPGASGLPRPAAWWGQKKSSRFSMPDSFDSIRGAAGWQQSNPSALDMASLLGSLETMAMAPGLLDANLNGIDFGSEEYAKKIDESHGIRGYGQIMPALRQKSQRLTAYLEYLLLSPNFLPSETNISIVTPKEGRFRGSQLSVCIPNRANKSNGQIETKMGGKSDVPPPIDASSFVARVHHSVETQYGVVCDIRNPDILRFGPVAQYSSFEDVWRTADALRRAILEEM